jgi:hypothetical protein
MIPSITELHDILFDEHACNHFLEQSGVFYETLQCPGCGQAMVRYLERMAFRCPSKRCRKEATLKKHTFFEGSMLKTNQIMQLAFFG